MPANRSTENPLPPPISNEVLQHHLRSQKNQRHNPLFSYAFSQAWIGHVGEPPTHRPSLPVSPTSKEHHFVIIFWLLRHTRHNLARSTRNFRPRFSNPAATALPNSHFFYSLLSPRQARATSRRPGPAATRPSIGRHFEIPFFPLITNCCASFAPSPVFQLVSEALLAKKSKISSHVT